MARKGYSRDDVDTHSDGFRDSLPAVNVKVYGSIRDAKVWRDFQRDEGPDDGFTLEWIEEHVSEERLGDVFQHACEAEYEYLEGWATRLGRGRRSAVPG